MALYGAKQQIVQLASQVKRREVPPIELRLWSGAKPLEKGKGGKAPEKLSGFYAPVNGIVTKSQTAIQGVR